MTQTLESLVGEGGDVVIAGLAHDSRRVTPGALFFCVPGLDHDGHAFAADAVRRGAVALVVERSLDVDVPQVRMPDVRAAMPPIAARYFGNPSAEIPVVGVTGTDGKTTTASMIAAVLRAAHGSCGVLGTVETVIGGRRERPVLTTPEAIDVQRGLRAMVEAGDAACVMEVSSHGLAMQRVDSVGFDATVFTNLSRDHLDYHSSMSDYFHAKRRLLVDRPGVAIVNAGDDHGRVLALHDETVTFAVGRKGDYRGDVERTTLDGTLFRLSSAAGAAELTLSLPGRHNVENALAAFATAVELGVDPDLALEAIDHFPGVPGRFQLVDEGQSFAVVVDFAHTPAGLEAVLRTAREVAECRVLCVFGCAGGRDRGARAPMGEVASRLADVVILTTDDPKGEDPADIVEQIRAGADVRARVVLDREEAIRAAIQAARRGDLVLLAGRGHEDLQLTADGDIPFDDVEVARKALRATARRGAGSERSPRSRTGATALQRRRWPPRRGR